MYLFKRLSFFGGSASEETEEQTDKHKSVKRSFRKSKRKRKGDKSSSSGAGGSKESSPEVEVASNSTDDVDSIGSLASLKSSYSNSEMGSKDPSPDLERSPEKEDPPNDEVVIRRRRVKSPKNEEADDDFDRSPVTEDPSNDEVVIRRRRITSPKNEEADDDVEISPEKEDLSNKEEDSVVMRRKRFASPINEDANDDGILKSASPTDTKEVDDDDFWSKIDDETQEKPSKLLKDNTENEIDDFWANTNDDLLEGNKGSNVKTNDEHPRESHDPSTESTKSGVDDFWAKSDDDSTVMTHNERSADNEEGDVDDFWANNNDDAIPNKRSANDEIGEVDDFWANNDDDTKEKINKRVVDEVADDYTEEKENTSTADEVDDFWANTDDATKETPNTSHAENDEGEVDGFWNSRGRESPLFLAREATPQESATNPSVEKVEGQKEDINFWDNVSDDNLPQSKGESSPKSTENSSLSKEGTPCDSSPLDDTEHVNVLTDHDNDLSVTSQRSSEGAEAGKSDDKKEREELTESKEGTPSSGKTSSSKSSKRRKKYKMSKEGSGSSRSSPSTEEKVESVSKESSPTKSDSVVSKEGSPSSSAEKEPEDIWGDQEEDLPPPTPTLTLPDFIPKPPPLPVDEPPSDSDTLEDKSKIQQTAEERRRNFVKKMEAPMRRRSIVQPDSRERNLSDSFTEPEEDTFIGFLDAENYRAEARLAQRRQARVEAREIRMKERERLQKEQEENSDRISDLHVTAVRPTSMSPRERAVSTNSYHSSRRSSEDSIDDTLSLRDIRHELKEAEEKFRKAMIANAQLDNEKAALAYQVELLKDKLEDLEEAHSQLGKEHRERCREHDAVKRAALKLKEELTNCRSWLEERERLIEEYGLVIVGGEVNESGELTPRQLVTKETKGLLDALPEGSLDMRLSTLAKEKNELADEVRHLKLELEEENNRSRLAQQSSNGPIGDELQQTLNDYRFRQQKSEQEINTLTATVARLESQVMRYKSAAEESEKAEEELKQEKRKLMREHRESIARIEELETSNSHLQRRMDKLNNAKSTLLKEL